MFRFQRCHHGAAVASGGSRGRSERRWTSPPLCSGHEGASSPGRNTVNFYCGSQAKNKSLYTSQWMSMGFFFFFFLNSDQSGRWFYGGMNILAIILSVDHDVLIS